MKQFIDNLERTEQIIGRAGLEKLNNSRVVIVGLGGVGSYTLEALVRAGVGKLVVIDHDLIERTNLNRQLLALSTNQGQLKVEVARKRALDINPEIEIEAKPVFCSPVNCESILQELLTEKLDYVVDAIDVIPSKVALIKAARELNIPVASCMGTGNKLDPTAFRTGDISETQICPLARAVRQQLRRSGITSGVETVYSVETPRGERRERLPGSISFVPSVAGLILAGIVVRKLLN